MERSKPTLNNANVRRKKYTYQYTPVDMERLRFQQSGCSCFCLSANILASKTYKRLSSAPSFFHLSPRSTLIALRNMENNGELKTKVPSQNISFGLTNSFVAYILLPITLAR